MNEELNIMPIVEEPQTDTVVDDMQGGPFAKLIAMIQQVLNQVMAFFRNIFGSTLY